MISDRTCKRIFSPIMNPHVTVQVNYCWQTLSHTADICKGFLQYSFSFVFFYNPKFHKTLYTTGLGLVLFVWICEDCVPEIISDLKRRHSCLLLYGRS